MTAIFYIHDDELFKKDSTLFLLKILNEFFVAPTLIYILNVFESIKWFYW